MPKFDLGEKMGEISPPSESKNKVHYPTVRIKKNLDMAQGKTKQAKVTFRVKSTGEDYDNNPYTELEIHDIEFDVKEKKGQSSNELERNMQDELEEAAKDD